MRHLPVNPVLAAAVAALVIAAAPGWYQPAAAQAAPAAATQTTAERGVTVKVTPRAFSGAVWEFAVVLDTHVEDLKDDLQKSAMLVVDGREVAPVAWQGPGPGGHHREGTISFAAPVGATGTVELRIQRAGETAPRVFRWDAAALK